jgi:integrase
MANYHAAIAGETPQRGPVAGRGTLARLVDIYQASQAWARLSGATQSQRANIYRRVCKTAGDAPYASIAQKHIKDGVAARAKTPFAANDFLKAMRGLFGWAVTNDHVTSDPTKGVNGYPHKTEGFHTWTEEEIATFETHWPVGTRERLALAILLFTGLRRGDAATLGRQHIKSGVITIRTAKTGQLVIIPILQELAEIIAATKTGDLAFIATASGAPMTTASFGNWFREACAAAGVPGAAHGLRKAFTTRLADSGASELQLNAALGWANGSRQSATYTEKANRAKLARDAMAKLKKDTA